MTAAKRLSGGTLASGAVGVVLAAALLAGCTTGSSPAPARNTTPPASPVTSAVPTVTTPSTPPSTPVTTAAPPSRSSTPPANTCRQLTVRVLEGGAIHGQEIAAAQFVNAGSTACTMTGFPTVVLRLAGKTLVTASPEKGKTPQPVRLAPGAQAESRITDYTTCNAPLSDTIVVTAPAGAATQTRPFQLRGCRVVVAPLSLSS